MPEVLIFLAILLIPLIWFVVSYNRFVRLARHLDESWSNIDVELKRRHDLIPKLVSTVKGYAAHETRALENLVSLRAEAMAERDRARVAQRERQLEQGMAGVFAVAESYPKLQADAHFLALQKELALTEDRIAAARRVFNGNVRDLNSSCEQVPTNVIASMFGFTRQEFFELGDPGEREPARVEVEP